MTNLNQGKTMDRISKMLALAASMGLAFAVEVAHADEPIVTVIKAGPATDAMRVVRDQETGRIRMATPEEIAAMASVAGSASASRFAPTVLGRSTTTMVSRPGGGATIRRSVDDLDAVVIERGADGKMSMRHGGDQVPRSSTQNLPKE
jgi:hypothetical protein